MSRVLVTGCNGTIGRYVTQALLRSGHSVVGIALEPNSRIVHPNLQYYSADIGDKPSIGRVLGERVLDVVVHLAALVHVRNQQLGFVDYSSVNYRASESLFRIAVKRGIRRILFASTIEVYGPTQANQAIDESSPCRPESDYARSKFLAEEALQGIAGEASCAYAIMRLAPVYASDFRLNLDKRLYLRPSIGYCLSNGEYSLGLCSVRNRLACCRAATFRHIQCG